MSIEYTDLWPKLQQDILGLLLSDSFIGTRAGLAVEPGDIKSNIDTKLAKVVGAGLDGKNGVGFLVLPIERAQDEDSSAPFSPLKLTITVQFVENVIINQSNTGTQIPIRIYAARAARIMKLYTPVGFTQSLVAADPVIAEFTEDTSKNLRVGQVEFTASEADFAILRRLNRPRITVAGDVTKLTDLMYKINSGVATVTVTQPDAAQIFYSLDGSHPYDRNPQAKIYEGPVCIEKPCMFRTRAFGDDSDTIGSDTAALNFC